MPARPLTNDARILEMRKWIASADERGLSRQDMLLQLSERDVAGLKRSSAVETHEISFVEGRMRFLDVEVVASTTTSGLTEREEQ